MTTEETSTSQDSPSAQMPETFEFKAMTDDEAMSTLDGAMDLLPLNVQGDAQAVASSEWTIAFADASSAGADLSSGLLGDLDAMFQF